MIFYFYNLLSGHFNFFSPLREMYKKSILLAQLQLVLKGWPKFFHVKGSGYNMRTFFEGRGICTRATADTETSIFFRQLIGNGLGFETAERLLKRLKDINTWEK